MTRKTKIITLGILGSVAALGLVGCCAGWFDPLTGHGGHGGGRHWGGRSGPIWFGGGSSHSSGASRGTGGTSSGGFGATASRGGGIGA